YGATITNASVPVTISLATNPTAATLSGTLTRTAVNGIATFNDLSIDKAGTGYRLAASASGVTGATSDPLDVFGACLGTPVFSRVADPGSNTEPLLARGVQGLSGDANRDLVVLHGNGLISLMEGDGTGHFTRKAQTTLPGTSGTARDLRTA